MQSEDLSISLININGGKEASFNSNCLFNNNYFGVSEGINPYKPTSSAIVFNSATNTLQIENCKFINNSAYTNGNGIVSVTDKLIITDSVF